MRELREASIIKNDDPKLYASLAGRGEIRRDVQRFLQVVSVAKRHNMSINEIMKSPTWLVQALTEV